MNFSNFDSSLNSNDRLFKLSNKNLFYQISCSFQVFKEQEKRTFTESRNISTQVKPKFDKSSGYFDNFCQKSCLFQPSKKQPLSQFVNLLMKHGKKDRAKIILEKSVSLFVQNLYNLKNFPTCKLKNSENLYNPKTKSSVKLDFETHDKSRFYRSFYGSKERALATELALPITCYSKKKLSKVKSYKFYFEKTFQIGFLFWFISNYKKVFYSFYIHKIFFFGKCKSKLWQLPSLEKPLREPQTVLSTMTTLKKINNDNCLFWAIPKNMYGLKFKEIRVIPIIKSATTSSWFKNARVFPLYSDKAYGNAAFSLSRKNTFLFSLYKAISNVKPPLECRGKRFGGANRQIPATVSEPRQWGFALRWIIEAAQSLSKSKKNKPFKDRDLSFQCLSSTFSFESKTLKPKFLVFPSSVIEDKELKKQEKYLNNLSFKIPPKKQTFFTVHRKTPLFCFFLAEALLYAYYKRGYAYKKRNLWIETSLANRAYLRYRWW